MFVSIAILSEYYNNDDNDDDDDDVTMINWIAFFVGFFFQCFDIVGWVI